MAYCNYQIERLRGDGQDSSACQLGFWKKYPFLLSSFTVSHSSIVRKRPVFAIVNLDWRPGGLA